LPGKKRECARLNDDSALLVIRCIFFSGAELLGAPFHSEEPPVPEASLAVVCVDDDHTVLDLVSSSAEDTEDFRVVAVATHATALLGLLREHRPDVLVIDHGLDDIGPVIDLTEGSRGHRHLLGLELVAIAREVLPEATIVLFTGWEGLETSAHNLGVDVFIQKPNIEAIWPAVRRARRSVVGQS
jgi:ActR/RegA family two-component response regulator